RLVLRTQPRSDRPTCVKCIALIHNDQFSIPGILPLAVTLGLAAFISLTGALALIVVWSAMTAVMRHEDLHSAKTAIVRQIRYPDLDVVNPSRATTGTFGAHQGCMRGTDQPVRRGVAGTDRIFGLVALDGVDVPTYRPTRVLGAHHDATSLRPGP